MIVTSESELKEMYLLSLRKVSFGALLPEFAEAAVSLSFKGVVTKLII